MSDPDQKSMWPVGIAEDLPEGLWDKGEYPGLADGPLIDPMAGLANLGFLKAALRRRKRLWQVLAIAGLLAGAGIDFALPASSQAAATVLLADPGVDPNTQIFNDLALSQSTTVAQDALRQLGLAESPSAFLNSYTVTSPSNQTIQITLNATSSDAAVQQVSAVAAAFLTVRAQYEQAQEQVQEATLNQQVNLAQENLNSVNNQLKKVSAEASTPQQQARLTKLQQEQQAAESQLGEVQQDATESIVAGRTQTRGEIADTKVIDAAAPVKHSRVKRMLIYAGGGLFAGLVLGVGGTVIAALVSGRLRRRDDIARAIGAPVGLSLGPLRPGRRSGGGDQDRDRDMRRLVEYLRDAIPARRSGPASLGVVAIDDPETAAQAVVSLAASTASKGRRVLLADLSTGSHAARLLGESQPGVRKVSYGNSHLMVAIPNPDDVNPVGPLTGKATAGNSASDDVASASGVADLLLTLATLDPGSGGDHFATWATDAVAMVTAGGASAETIRSVGEMVRMSGARLDSVVLVGADSTDQSVGVWQPVGLG